MRRLIAGLIVFVLASSLHTVSLADDPAETVLRISVLEPTGAPYRHGYEAVLCSQDGKELASVAVKNGGPSEIKKALVPGLYMLLIRDPPYRLYVESGLLLKRGANAKVVKVCNSCIPPVIGMPFEWNGPADLRGSTVGQACRSIQGVKIEVINNEGMVAGTGLSDANGCFLVAGLPKADGYQVVAKFPTGHMLVVNGLRIEGVASTYLTLNRGNS